MLNNHHAPSTARAAAPAATPIANVSLTAGQRNWALALLVAAGMLNIFDRQIVNILAQAIKTELSLSDAQLGLLTGTAFGLFYAILGIPLGRIADKVDRFKLIAISLALWSAFTALCGGAGSFRYLFLARMGVGIGEAGSQPASTALIPDLFSQRRRASAMSALLVGAPLGSFLGLLVGGLVGAAWGWRIAFVVAGIPGFLLALFMLLTLRDPRPKPAADVPVVRLIEALRLLLSRAEFRWLILALTCGTFLVYASGAWLPPLLIRVHGMSMAETGSWTALAVGLGGGLGALGGGILCDTLRPRLAQVESKVLIGIFLVSIPALLITVFSTARTPTLAAMLLFDVCAYAWLAPTIALIQNAATASTRALAVALCSTLASIVSLGIGLPLVGLLSDALTPQLGKDGIRYALAAGIGVAAILGILSHWRALGARNCP